MQGTDEYVNTVRLAARGICRLIVGIGQACLCNNGRKASHCIAVTLFGDEARAAVNSIQQGLGNGKSMADRRQLQIRHQGRAKQGSDMGDRQMEGGLECWTDRLSASEGISRISQDAECDYWFGEPGGINEGSETSGKGSGSYTNREDQGQRYQEPFPRSLATSQVNHSPGPARGEEAGPTSEEPPGNGFERGGEGRSPDLFSIEGGPSHNPGQPMPFPSGSGENDLLRMG